MSGLRFCPPSGTGQALDGSARKVRAGQEKEGGGPGQTGHDRGQRGGHAGRPTASGRGGEPEGRGRGAAWHGHILRRLGMEDVFPEPGSRRDQGCRDSAGCREGAGGSHDPAPGAEIQGGTGECQAGDHASRAPEGRGKGQGDCDGCGNGTFGPS